MESSLGERSVALPKVFRPAIYILQDEVQYMRLMDVMRMMSANGSMSVIRVHGILTAFQALAPFCEEVERMHEPDLRITDEAARRIYTLSDFSENMEPEMLERLYINLRWASRIIVAHERKGGRAAEVDLPPRFLFFGRRRRLARVYLVGENSSFLM
jgi:hypothetical protein